MGSFPRGLCASCGSSWELVFVARGKGVARRLVFTEGVCKRDPTRKPPRVCAYVIHHGSRPPSAMCLSSQGNATPRPGSFWRPRPARCGEFKHGCRAPLRGRGAVILTFMPPLRAFRVSAGWYQFVYVFAKLWRWRRETQTPGVPVAAGWQTVLAGFGLQPAEAIVVGGTSRDAPVAVGGPCTRKAAR